MTDVQARMILHDLEHQGASSLSMEQIYAIRRAQGALDDISEAIRLLKLSLEQNNPKCKYCIHDLEDEQHGYNPCCTGETANCKWVHADEALKLIGEDGDTDGIAIQETEV